MDDICIDCCKQLVIEEGCICAACIDFHKMQEEEYQEYLLELKEAASSLLNEEFEYFTLAPPSEDFVDDIPF